MHTQVVVLFHLFRIAAGILAVLATYDFLALFITQVHWRRWATSLAVIGGGLGWLIPLSGQSTLLGSLPLEFYSPEAFGFLMYYSLPHLVLARAFLFWGLRAYLLADQTSGRSFILGSLGTGILWLLTSFAQPLTGMIVGAIPAAHLGVTGFLLLIGKMRGEKTNWQTWKQYFARAVLAGLVAGPFVIYNIMVFRSDPLLSSWAAQSAINSPHPLHYLLAYGLVLPFSVMGLLCLCKQKLWDACFLAIWVVVFMLAIYIPFSLQRRLNEGVWVALLALAGLAFEQSPFLNKKINIGRAFASGIMGLSLISTLLLLSGGFLLAAYPAGPLFVPEEKASVFEALASRAKAGEVVLSSYETGNALPAWAPLPVVIGITTLSAHIDVLRPQVRDFYQEYITDQQREEFIQEFKIRYIFWGPEERRLGHWDPRQANFLVPVYAKGDFSVFMVP